MKFEYALVKTIYMFVALIGIGKGKECYKAEFSDDVWPCEDFENNHLMCEPLELGMVEGKDGELGLNGLIKVKMDIEEGTMMNVEVWKMMDIGKEYLYHAQGDICNSLKDDSTPWYPMVNSMGISACPIAVDNYEIKDMILNLDHAKDMMNHELCGDYIIQMSMTRDLDKLSCYELGVAFQTRFTPTFSLYGSFTRLVL